MSSLRIGAVHTMEALSPLFTVVAYALLFDVSYSTKNYISLLLLSLGVMLMCTAAISASKTIDYLCAFGSAITFVSQNVFFEKIVPSCQGAQSLHELDRLYPLFYSSSMACLLMIPISLHHDSRRSSPRRPNPHISHPTHRHTTPHSVIDLACDVLDRVAQQTRRVAVTCIAIVWFAQPVYPIQAVGITMTFVGLYHVQQRQGRLRDGTGEHKMRRVEAARDHRLPTTMAEPESDSEVPRSHQETAAQTPSPEFTMSSAYGLLAHAHIRTSPPRRNNFRPRPFLAHAHKHNVHRHEHPPSASAVQPGADAGVLPWKLPEVGARRALAMA